MNVLFYIANYPGFGGIEKVTTYLANGFVAQHHKVTLLTFAPTHNRATTQDLDPSVDLLCMPCQTNIEAESNRIFVNQTLFSGRFDIVIYQDSYYPEANRLLDTSRWAERPFKFIVVEHNMPTCHVRTWRHFVGALSFRSPMNWLRALSYPIQKQRRKPRVVKRHAELVTLADHYVLLSDAYKQELAHLTDMQLTDKVCAIPNPLTITLPAAIPQKKKQCLYVARLERDKGIDLLMDIWNRFVRHHRDWELIIVGTGVEEPQLRMAIESGRLPNAKAVGTHHDLTPFYAEASLFLLTSRFEGWGLVLTEAMAYGTIPIAFHSYAALPDIIDHERNGFMIPAFERQTFAETLHRLATADNLDSLRNAAHAKAKMFSLDRIVPMWEAIFKR